MIVDEAGAVAFCAGRLDTDGMVRLSHLAALLTEENQLQNLVSDKSLISVWQRHFADSAQLLDFLPDGVDPILDLGSGAGFPGLVLAIARPDRPVILIESRKRRVDWLRRAIGELELTACTVLGARLEDVPTVEAAAITARAFAPLDKLLHLSARFSTPDTVWLLPKGRSAAQELAEQAAEVRGMFHVEQSKTDPSGGILVGQGTVRVT